MRILNYATGHAHCGSLKTGGKPIISSIQPVQQHQAVQGNFSIIRYNLGKGFQGYALKRKLMRQLEEEGFISGKYGHLRPQEGWSHQQVPIPGFLYGNILRGYQLRVYMPHNPQFQASSLAVKDICDRL